jgi:hypothetical protein
MHRQPSSPPLGLAPAVLGFVMVHATLRRDAAAIVAAAERSSAPALKGRVSLLGRVLSVHHRGEDDLLLPALRARHPGFSEPSALIEQQHVGLDAAVAELKSALARADAEATPALARRAQGLLEEHLTTEERELLPVWQASFSGADHENFAARLRRSTRLRDIGVMVPWLLEATPAEFREFALGQVPAPTRVLHELWWRRRFRREFAFAA